MKTKFLLSVALVMAVTLVTVIISNSKKSKISSGKSETDFEEHEASYQYARWKYEADMIKDPVTGEVPFGLREQEIEFAKTIPQRNTGNAFSRTSVQNNYLPAGPNNIGGRTRALAYDVRYNSTTNRVILSGSISGGIYRSADGGATWTRVSPQNEVHNVATFAQDPRSGSQDTWYAGGGEYIGSSADGTGAGYLAHGIVKSTDNGVTWTRLPLNTITDIGGATLPAGVAERFDHTFDYVHKLAVNPVNGHLYIAGHRRLVRSTDGGATFQVVFGSAITAFAANGQLDVACSPTGKIYLAASGAMPDMSLRGIWKSTTGNQGSWTRLSGGQTLGVDSVANWRGNAYNFQVVGGSNFYDTRRTLIALAPSNENILYVLYENGLSNKSPNFNKEADLFKLDMTSGNNWTNLSANVPDFPGGNHDATDPFAIQGGYDLLITVKPNDPNAVFIGGTSLYRSTNGFATTGATSWIGGYGNTLPDLSFYGQTSNPTNPGKWSHPDIHNLVFNPSNFNEAICANDGGIQITSNIMGTAGGNEPVAWNTINNYQTLQYYYVAIDPGSGRNNFAGGAQDNGTRLRDKISILGTAPIDSNNHQRLVGGDGCAVGLSQFSGSEQYCYAGIQLGGIRRVRLQSSPTTDDIRPTGLTLSDSGEPDEFGEFVTNFRLNPDNTEDLYYVNFNRLFRTTIASSATSSSWNELTGVSSAVNASNGTNIGIRALAFSRGAYVNTHVLYFGTTDGRIFRLNDPRNAVGSALPVEITPSTSLSDLTGLNVQDIAVNPNNDNEIMVAITNYGRTVSGQFENVENILWTNNAKSATPTWKVAEGNLAGTSTSGFISARSCMIVVKKDASNNPVTEYYVGTAAGLFAVENLGTTLLANGSPTWQREGSSVLNFAVITSLAYRPVDNILLVGTHGNGMFYTSTGTPNLVTGVIDPVLNDKTFISSVRPTVGSSIVEYKTGNRFEIKKMAVMVYNMNGQEVYRKEANYQDGVVDISRFAKGMYILSITSDNLKYRHIQKFIR